MNEGDVVIAALPQSDGQIKNRPTVVVRKMPPYGDLLVCGVSSQLHLAVQKSDEFISPSDADFSVSGLKTASVNRLGFLATLPRANFIGRIGTIEATPQRRLLLRLSAHLSPPSATQSVP